MPRVDDEYLGNTVCTIICRHDWAMRSLTAYGATAADKARAWLPLRLPNSASLHTIPKRADLRGGMRVVNDYAFRPYTADARTR